MVARGSVDEVERAGRDAGCAEGEVPAGERKRHGPHRPLPRRDGPRDDRGGRGAGEAAVEVGVAAEERATEPGARAELRERDVTGVEREIERSAAGDATRGVHGRLSDPGPQEVQLDRAAVVPEQRAQV